MRIRDLYIAVLTLIFAVIVSVNVFAKDWGLGFPNPGQKPDGNETAGYLRNYDAYFVGSGDEKVIYLTFDAGYENGCTAPILDALKKHSAPATFFLVGSYIKQHPDIVKRMVEEGHIVANHTLTHPDMTKIGGESFSNELLKTEEIYRNVTGQEMPKFYRPPQGKYSEDNLRAAKEMNYKTVFWSLAYRDFEENNQPSKEQAFAKLLPRIHPGAIVLLHSTSKANAVLLDELLSKYREMGYEFRSLYELN